MYRYIVNTGKHDNFPQKSPRFSRETLFCFFLVQVDDIFSSTEVVSVEGGPGGSRCQTISINSDALDS